MKTCYVTLLLFLFVGCHVRDMEKEYVFRIPDELWADSSQFHSPINDLAEARSIARCGIEDPNDIGDMSNYGYDYMYYRLHIFDSRCVVIARISRYGQENYIIYRDKKGNIKLCLDVASKIVGEEDNNLYSSIYTIVKGDSIIRYIIRAMKEYECADSGCKYDTIVYRMLMREWLKRYYDYPRKKSRLSEL